MRSLYVLGARQRNEIFKKSQEQNLYESALILKVDLDTERVTTCIEYETPREVCALENSSSIFKSASLRGNTLYCCTSTEIIIFELPEFRKTGYISLPCFNDVHHVTPVSDGNLVVVSTGLDMVFKITPGGEVLHEWTVLDEPMWSRFLRHVDYRKVETTKPHEAHPNFAFELEGELWVTRFIQRDAICLTKPGARIDIAIQKPHDGLVAGDRIYFTTVDGRLVIVNRRTLEVDEVVNLNSSDGEQKVLLGWCRGLHLVDARHVWVGFTRIRKTRFVENVLWVRNLMKNGAAHEKPTHISLYDPVEKKCLREIDLEPHGMNIVFSILPAE